MGVYVRVRLVRDLGILPGGLDVVRRQMMQQDEDIVTLSHALVSGHLQQQEFIHLVHTDQHDCNGHQFFYYY